MRKITMTAVALMVFITAIAQDPAPYVRKGAQVPLTSAPPTLNGEMDEAVYTGNAMDIAIWNSAGGTVDPTPVDGVEAKFWFAYDDDNLYVYSEITVPNKHVRDEIGITVSIDVESQNYGWQADPFGDDGFIFSKIEFGEEVDGADARYAMEEGVERKVRQWDWVFLHSDEGYQVEGRLAWDDISTNAAKVAEFKERGVFYFDIGYKLSTENAFYVAWSNDDNNSYQRTTKVGIVNFQHVRKETVVSKTETAPAHNAFRETTVYTGDGYPIANWTTRGPAPMMPAPVENTSGHFWMAYDDDNLYVFGELTVPASLDPVHEVGIMISLDVEDARYGWQADPFGDDGFVFSKMEFATEAQGADARYALDEGDPRLIRQFNYVYVKDGDTFEYEVIIPWNSITSNQTTLDDFRERGTFYFDIGYKLSSNDTKYFAWSNNDNNIWRETHRAGVVTLEGFEPDDGVFVGNVKYESFQVFPNPARNVLYINSENPVSVAEVYNIIGARVLSADVQSGSLDISGLKEGVYIIRVSYENGKTGVSRFVKN
jgi:hypothetical protein